MTTKGDFSDEEWKLLLGTPPLVGTAVMVSGRSGLGSLKEAMAVAQGVLAAKSQFPDSPLIQALVQARRDGERSDVEKLSGPYLRMNPTEIADAAVAQCHAATKIVQERCSTDDLKAFQAWIMGLARHVAEAAKEGAFLGLGGEKVSDPEKDLLARLEQAMACPPASSN